MLLLSLMLTNNPIVLVPIMPGQVYVHCVFLPGRVCACLCVCTCSLAQGPGTEARCNRLFQRLGLLPCCGDLSAAGRPANTSPLATVLQLAVYYRRGPRPPGSERRAHRRRVSSVCLRATGCGATPFSGASFFLARPEQNARIHLGLFAHVCVFVFAGR